MLISCSTGRQRYAKVYPWCCISIIHTGDVAKPWTTLGWKRVCLPFFTDGTYTVLNLPIWAYPQAPESVSNFARGSSPSPIRQAYRRFSIFGSARNIRDQERLGSVTIEVERMSLSTMNKHIISFREPQGSVCRALTSKDRLCRILFLNSASYLHIIFER